MFQQCYWCENLGQADHLPNMVPELLPSYPLPEVFPLHKSDFLGIFKSVLREFHCNLELHAQNLELRAQNLELCA
jgi:hypothetical protein